MAQRYDPYRQWVDEEQQTTEQQAVNQALGSSEPVERVPGPNAGLYNLPPPTDTNGDGIWDNLPEPDRMTFAQPKAAAGSPTTATGGINVENPPAATQVGRPTTPTPQFGVTDTGLEELYQKYLKRSGSPQEYQSHYGNPGGLPGVYQTILGSPEYKALQQSLGQTATSGGYGDLQGDYGGYSAPQWMPETWGNVLGGWDSTKWSDADHLTPKYVVGRILSNYPATTEGISQAIVDIQRAYPGTTFDGKDKITIPGVGTIDILVNASGGGSGWSWQVPGASGVTNTTNISSLLPPNFNWSGMSPNDLLRMAMSRLAMNRVFWDNPMNTPW